MKRYEQRNGYIFIACEDMRICFALTARFATAALDGAKTRALLAANTISTMVDVFPR